MLGYSTAMHTSEGGFAPLQIGCEITPLTPVYVGVALRATPN